jgi:predicted component of type VI protein secretion system
LFKASIHATANGKELQILLDIMQAREHNPGLRSLLSGVKL